MVLSNQPSGRGLSANFTKIFSSQTLLLHHLLDGYCVKFPLVTDTILSKHLTAVFMTKRVFDFTLLKKDIIHLLEMLSNRDEARRSKRLTYTAKTDGTNEIAVQNNPLKSIPAYREAAKVSYSLNHFIKPGCT